MELIRNNIFETDSSSTHALVIAKEYKELPYHTHSKVVNPDSYLKAGFLCEDDYTFDRSPFKLCNSWDEKLAYMYIVLRSRITEEDHYYKSTGCKLITVEDFEKFKTWCVELYNELITDEGHHISIQDVFEILELDSKYGYVVGGVDHDYEVPNELIEKCITDKDYIKRFIFCRDSYIAVSGDEYNRYYIKTIGFEDDYTDRNEFDRKLEEYKKDFDVYFKGD